MAAKLEYEEDEAQPLLDALEKLRWRLFKIAVALFVGVLAGFALSHYTDVIELLVHPIRPFLAHQDGRLAALSPLTGFMLELKVGLLLGVAVALPMVLYQLWSHFSPVLQLNERKLILPSIFVSMLLFAGGVGVGYIVLPLSLGWLFGFQADYVTVVINADDYFSFAVRLLLAFGIVFQMPVVLMILTVLGIVTPTFLRDKRRHAVVIIAVLSALITPGDVTSMFLMMVPMVILYEASIHLSRVIYRRGRPELEEEAKAPAGQVGG